VPLAVRQEILPASEKKISESQFDQILSDMEAGDSDLIIKEIDDDDDDDDDDDLDIKNQNLGQSINEMNHLLNIQPHSEAF